MGEVAHPRVCCIAQLELYDIYAHTVLHLVWISVRAIEHARLNCGCKKPPTLTRRVHFFLAPTVLLRVCPRPSLNIMVGQPPLPPFPS